MSNKNTKQKTQECIHDANEFGTFDNVTGICWVCGKTATQTGEQTRWEDTAMKLSHQVMEQTEKLQAAEAQLINLCAVARRLYTLGPVDSKPEDWSALRSAITKAENLVA